MTYRVRCKRRARNYDGPEVGAFSRWISETVNREWRRDTVWHKNLRGRHDISQYNVAANEAYERYHAGEQRPEPKHVRRAWPAVSRKDAERKVADRDAYLASIWQNDYEEYTEMVEDGYRAAGLL